MEKKKKLLWGISGLVAACCVIAYFAFFYPWPSSKDNSATVGTIGGVEKLDRQRVEQIAEQDVVLSDAQLQQLLQNDQVQSLIRNKAFQKAMQNKAFAGLLQEVHAHLYFHIFMGRGCFLSARPRPLGLHSTRYRTSKACLNSFP